MDPKWYHVCWPRLTAKHVAPVVSISWASCHITMADPLKSRACERSGKRSGAGTKSGDRGSGTVSGHSRKRLSASGAWSGGPRSGSRAESGCHKTLERTLSDKSAAHAALTCSGLKSYNPFACVVTRPYIPCWHFIDPKNSGALMVGPNSMAGGAVRLYLNVPFP